MAKKATKKPKAQKKSQNKTTKSKQSKTQNKKIKSKKEKQELNIDITKHVLVPKHEVLSEEEKEKLLKELNIEFKQLPKIKINDPAIKHLKVKPGDVIKITRSSPIAGKTIYYRGVIE